jgi:hypothetical protein
VGGSGVTGIVTAVNGTAKATACGVAATAGFFVVMNPKSTTSTTVDVTVTTRFFEPKNPQGEGPFRRLKPNGANGPKRLEATFADVCVGKPVFATGTTVSGAVSATAVFVFPPRGHQPAGLHPESHRRDPRSTTRR